MQVTILQRPTHCSCGAMATTVCTQCNTLVCRQHMGNWEALLGRWLQLKAAYSKDQAPAKYRLLVFGQGGMANFEVKRSPGWFAKSGEQSAIAEIASGKAKSSCWSIPWKLEDEVTKPVLARLGIDQHRPEDRLCFDCVESLFLKLLRPIEKQILKLKAAGRLCEICCRERDRDRGDENYLKNIGPAMAYVASEHCSKCRIPVCGAHYERCSKCQTVWCKPHWVGYATSQWPDRQCASCAGLLRRMFQRPETRN
jgi:hypothetical protein